MVRTLMGIPKWKNLILEKRPTLLSSKVRAIQIFIFTIFKTILSVLFVKMV